MRLFFRLLPYMLGLLGTLVLSIFAAGYSAYYYLQPALPSVEEMRDIQLQIPLRVYSRDGKLIEQIGKEKRTPVSFDEIPEIVVQAFLAAEDDRFFEHPGFDYQGILRAALKLATTGSRAQGGSTITQQLAREYFLTKDRTFVRKGKELILAIQIENEFPKEEILALYLNKIFLGQRAYGIAAAAEVFFGKTLDELSIAEAATIAGLPAAPSRLNPVANPDQSRDRRGYVLRRMRELDFITEAEFAEALQTPMVSRLHGPRVELNAPYVGEMARSFAVSKLGADATIKGYQVITTVDSRLQRASSAALRKALLEYDRRHGFRGALTQTNIDELTAAWLAAAEDSEAGDALATLSIAATPAEQTDIALQDHLQQYTDYRDLHVAIVTELLPPAEREAPLGKDESPDGGSAQLFVRDRGRVTVPWEKLRWSPYINDNVIGDLPTRVEQMLAVGDVVYLLNTASGWQLAQLPDAQGAFVALDPKDGATIAITGGFDYYASKFNRATQALRQPGSSFKPFIYSAALENGFTAATIVNDAPVVLDSAGQEESWRPENYSNKFYGPTRLREGLVRSMNLVSVRVLRKVGLRNALNHIRPFGFPPSALPRDLALALGSGGASPWQMAEGFAGLSSGGYAVNRYFIDRILDADGNVVYQSEPLSVCEPCAPAWFDGRDTLSAAADNEIETPEPPVVLAASDAAPEADEPAEVLSVVELLDPEVPTYDSTQSMISAAADWRPDYTQTPLFWSDRNQALRIITPQNAYIVYDMMRDVVRRGTGRRASALGRRDIGGKTGTSNNRRDAWFSGFNSEIVGIAWVGFDDDSRSLGAGEEGSRTALPMWIEFMDVALRGTAEAPLREPDGIVTVRILKATGELAPAGSADAMFEIFRAGTEPTKPADSGAFGNDDIFTIGPDDTSIF